MCPPLAGGGTFISIEPRREVERFPDRREMCGCVLMTPSRNGTLSILTVGRIADR